MDHSGLKLAKMKGNLQHRSFFNSTELYSHFQVGRNFIKAPDCLFSLPLGLGKVDHSNLADFDWEI